LPLLEPAPNTAFELLFEPAPNTAFEPLFEPAPNTAFEPLFGGLLLQPVRFRNSVQMAKKQFSEIYFLLSESRIRRIQGLHGISKKVSCIKQKTIFNR
jgi:hypothetical protein